jgi:putative phage-type endonuclease
MDENPFCCRDELIEQKKGRRVVKENARMARGKRLEPLARLKYQQITGIRVRPVCVVHDELPWLRASLDGLSEDGQIVLEIKCPNDKAHFTALRGNVPAYYFAQTQHQLAVTGCPVLHYWSYTDSDDFAPEEQVALVKVLPNREYIERLVARERLLWEELQRGDS